ncbi:MAG: transcriptional regulator [Bacteroidia bacterium]|nr:transcriptional regulator [Bacteroidia bacterium]
MKWKIFWVLCLFVAGQGYWSIARAQPEEEVNDFIPWTLAEINPDIPCARQIDMIFNMTQELSGREKRDILDQMSACENQPNGAYVFVLRKLYEANEALGGDNYFLAWEYFHLGMARLEELDPESPLREFFLIGVATGYLRTRAPHHAIRYLHQALKVNQRRKKFIPLNLLHVYSKMAQCHDQLMNLDSSYYYRRKAVDYCRNFRSTVWYPSSLNNLGFNYETDGNLDSAMYYYQKAFHELGEEFTPDRLYSAILDNIGNTYLKKNDLDQAYATFDQAYKWAIEYQKPPRLVSAGGKCILLLLRDQHPGRAKIEQSKEIMHRMDSVIHKFSPQLFAERKKEWFRARIRLNLVQGDIDGSWDQFVDFYDYNDSLSTTLSSKRLKALELFLVKTSDRFNDELNFADLEAEKSRQTLRFTLILGGLLLALLILVGWSLRNKVQFQRTELQVKDFRDKINQLELDNSSLKKKELEQELKLKNRDVTDLALEMQVRSKAKKDLILQLDDILKSASPNMQLRRLINDLRRQAGDEQISELKHTHPDQVNNNFKERLAEKYPDLTRAEKEFCELFLLDIPIKEIANLRKISAQSVRVAKYRLRKKLNLETQEDLTQFLKEL